MSNKRIPFLFAASIATCALLSSAAVLAGSLTYTGTNCSVSPACSTVTGALGTLTLPADIAFTDTFSTGVTSTVTDDWTFTISAATKTVATGSGVEFDAGGTKSGTITSFALYNISSGKLLIVTGTSHDSGEVFAIPTQKLKAGSYELQVVADGSYSGTLSAVAVPLPASAWLMVSGVAGLLVLARRRRDPMAPSSSAS
jgi:hypothetical protein